MATIDQPQEARVPADQKSSTLNSGARYTLSNFAAGGYTLLIKARDVFSNRVIEKRVNFTVKSTRDSAAEGNRAPKSRGEEVMKSRKTTILSLLFCPAVWLLVFFRVG